jgi:hypothetical protein
MDEANLRSYLRNGFKSETFECADMATDCGQWDTAGWEIAGIQRAFEAASSNSDDAAEGGSALE